MSRAVGLAVGLALLVPAAASAFLTVINDSAANYGEITAGSDGAPTAISVERAGAVVDSSGTSSGGGNAWLYIVPQTGDVLRVTVNGQPAFVRTYDGRPSVDASVCANATSFSGLRSSDASSVNYVAADLRSTEGNEPLDQANGTVTSASGETYGGTFDKAVGPGWVVTSSSQDVVNGVQYNSIVSRTVGACAPAPVPVVAPAPVVATAPDTTAPTGRLMAGLPFRGGIAALLGGRAVSTTMVGEAGVTVTQALYVNDGAKLPARAAGARKPTLLARGRAVSKHAGAVRLKLHATKKVRTLRHKRTVRVAIVTTLRDRAGNVKRLPVKRVVLERS